MRTDRNNNPTAFTTQLAIQAGLTFGKDYVLGDPFEGYYTAKLLHDPIELTIKVIDKVGFYTKKGLLRWVYIAIPEFIWNKLDFGDKKKVIHWMYQREGGKQLEHLFNA